MATTPRNQITQARNRTRTKLDLNNSAVSKTSDTLLSLLEGGDGSAYLRDQIDVVLNQLANGGAVDYNRAQLRRWSSIKEKIAYVVGSLYGHAADMGAVAGVADANDTNNLNGEALQAQIDIVLGELEVQLLNNQDFTESWILRHAAFNRFETKLNTSENASLASLANAIKKIASDEGYDTIAETMHFQRESDAQKIIKISEAVAMLTNEGVSIDKKTLEQFDKMAEKIKPLKDLDKHYKHLMNALNMVHRLAKKGYDSMINTSDERKLLATLKDMGIADVNSFIIDASKIDDVGDKLFLDKELHALKHKDFDKFKAALKKNNVTEKEFEAWFSSYFGYKTAERARKDFDKQKYTTFGHRLKDYEQDVNAWRGIARDRVLAAHARMVGTPLAFGPGDFDMVSSYFDKFKDIFFAHESDTAANGGGHFEQMRDIVAAIVRERVPMLQGGSRRYATGLRRAVAKLGNARVTRLVQRWQNADDAQLIALIIMAQSEATNTMFYHDKEVFAQKEGGMQRISKAVSRAELGREAVRDAISPAANTFLRLGEGAVKSLTKFGFGMAKPMNKVVSGLGKGASRTGKSLIGAINRGIEGRRYNTTKEWNFKRWKLPFYAAYPATLLVEKGLGLTDKGFAYTLKHGSKHIEGAKKAAADSYHGMVGRVKEGTGDKEVKYMYQGLTHAIESTTKLFGKTTSWVGQTAYNRSNTAQQRDVLAAFFEAAGQEENLAELMESSDLANMLNLKERGPYLFDEDGRVLGMDKAEKKTNSPESAASALEKSLEKQLEKLMQQADEQYNKANKANMDAKRTGDASKINDADIDFAHASVVRSKTKIIGGDIAKLQPLLKAPLDQNNMRRQADINAALSGLNTHLNHANTGALVTLRHEIGDNTRGLTHDKSAAYTTLLQQTAAEAGANGLVKSILNQISNFKPNNNNNAQNHLADLHARLQTAQASQAAAIQQKAQAEENYTRMSRELMNKKQFVAWLEIVEQFRENVQALSDEMYTAMTTPNADIKQIVDQMNSLAKNLDLMLFPEEKKEASKNTIDLNNPESLNNLTEEMKEKLRAVLGIKNAA